MAEAFAVSVATGFLGNFSSEILMKLGTFATTYEIPLMWGLIDELEKLKNTTDMILAVLEDAKEQQGKRKAVGLWLEMLKEAAYDVEDVMDEVAYEILRRKMENDLLPISLPFRNEMAHKVKDVIQKLDDIAKVKNDLNLKEGQASANKTSLVRETSEFFSDTEVFGREDEKSKIINMLLDDSVANKEGNFSVISIVGFGGLGKTTLAQLVFNDKEVSNRFDVREWVCVANDRSSDKTLLGEVFRQICERQLGSSNKGQMQRGIKEKLQMEKFLLVLDDVWDSSQWNDIKVILRCGVPGSKVIVTTRSEEVANEMETVHLIELGKLSKVYCWAVFEERAFRTGGPRKTNDLEKIGREIVKKCRGIPLAVKAMGNVMHKRKTFAEWMAIRNCENINVVKEEDVMNVLKLSYDHLPSPVKQCFLYCSIYPKDARIMKNDLIQQWMAHGYVQSSNDLEMEEVGNDYFKTLCCNSFFQDLEMDKHHDIKSCKMHDLVHDLAQLIIGKESLVFSHTTSTENINIRETRHLRVNLDEERDFSFPEDLYRKVRTFISNGYVANVAWEKFKFVRVLHLEDMEVVPSSICKLILLRYLSIDSGNLTVLPQSISQLYHLETLNVEQCPDLEELPSDIWKLTNLRHIYIGDFANILKKFGRLHGLRSISPDLFLGEEEDGRGIGELEHLNNLRGNLRIHNMEKVRNAMHVRRAKLMEKKKVYHLEILWSEGAESGDGGAGTNCLQAAEAFEAPPNLKELNVNGFPGKKLPLTTWLANGSLRYLVELKLRNCKNLQEIPPIWHIQPSLEVLEISSMNKVKVLGDKCTSTGAPVASRLKRLSLKAMAELEEWVENATINTNSFPCLEELTVEECGMPRIVPSHFPALQKLRVQNCTKLSLVLASCPSLKEIYVSKIYNLDMMCSSATNDRHHHLPSLTSLRVEHVPEFTAVPKGFLQSSEHLQSVYIKCCDKFQGFVDMEGELPLLFSSNLKQIKLIYCLNLECINVRGLTSLETLEMTHCQMTHYFESSIQGLQSLQALKNLELESVPIIMLTGCDAINGGCCWPHLEILKISSSRNLSLTVTQFPSLRVMHISSTGEVVMEPITNDDILASLTDLSIVRVYNLTSLPEGLLRSCSKSLKKLEIVYCYEFEGFIQQELQLLTSLEELRIAGVMQITSTDSAVMETASNLGSLTHLSILRVEDFTSMPKGLLQICSKSLKKLEIIDCPEFQGFIQQELQLLTSLEELRITKCAGLKSSPIPSEDLQRLPSLRELSIGEFSEELENLPFPAIEDSNSPWCSSLQDLTIWGGSKIKSLPHQLQHFTALRRLVIREFDSLVVLPEWLGNLSSLQYLSIHDCRHLMHLPSKQQLHRLTLLNSVSILDCPLLSVRLKSDDEERLKIPDGTTIW